MHSQSPEDWWGASIYSIVFDSGNVGWAVGNGLGDPFEYNVLRTLDSGTTWSPQFSCPWDAYLNSVKIIGSEGWAVGYQGVILHYPDECHL